MKAHVAPVPRPLRIVLERDEYDFFSAALLERELEVITETPVTIDFGRVRFVDASVFARLLRLYKRLQRLARCDPEIGLANVSTNIRNLFDIVGLTNLFYFV